MGNTLVQKYKFMESNVSTKELYDLGDQPPLGEVPSKMHAFMVRQDRFGKPIDAWKSEVIDVPTTVSYTHLTLPTICSV